jgi:putative endonuclease
MYTVYILKNILSGRHYIGSTNNITRRLEEHNRGQTKSTKKGQWILLYTEKLNNPKQAKIRERQIKSYKGGNAFKRLIAGVVQQ